MNIAFWIAASNLMIIALLLVIVPIWFRRDLKIDDNQQHNLDIARQKIAELKVQRELNKISKTEFDEQIAELEQALNADLDGIQNINKTTTQGRWVVFLLIPLLPISAIIIYQTIGSPQMLDIPVATAAPAPSHSADPENTSIANIDAMVGELLKRLEQKPDDLKGWLILGRTYMYQKKFALAAEAFAEADALDSDNADILVQYADALAMTRDGSIAGKPMQLISRALSINPDQANGLWLAGIAKANEGDFKTALVHWLRLEPLLVNDPASLAEVQKLIVNARVQTGQVAPVLPAQITPQQLAAKPSNASTTMAPALTVEVTISTEFQQQVKPSDTVFIYAQALQGMRMPLAIVRKLVKDLPVTVILSDAQAMAPTAKISGFEQVKILARISKAGSALPQSGDLLGEVAPVTVSSTEPIQVLISKVIN